MGVLISVLLASAVAALIVFGLLGRTPRCPRCRMASTAAEDEKMVNAFPPVFELVYRCPRCGTVVRRRTVGAFGD